MALGQYTPPARIESDRLKVTDLVGRPLLVKVIEYREAFTSQRFPDPKEVVIVDVVDVITGQVYVGPLWGAAAVVDGLKENAGRDITLPVMPVSVKSASGNDYIVLNPLEGQALQLAEAWYEKYPTAMEEARNARLAKAKPLGQVAPPEAPAAPAPAPAAPAPAPAAPAPAAPAPAAPAPAAPAPAAPAASNGATDDQPFPDTTPAAPASDNDVASALARLNAS